MPEALHPAGWPDAKAVMDWCPRRRTCHWCSSSARAVPCSAHATFERTLTVPGRGGCLVDATGASDCFAGALLARLVTRRAHAAGSRALRQTRRGYAHLPPASARWRRFRGWTRWRFLRHED
jgi:hypothetical protein